MVPHSYPFSEKDRSQNKLLLLYIAKEYTKKSKHYFGKTILEKIIFLAEWKMIEERVKGLNFPYFRYDYGPFSKEVSQEINDLKKTGLLEKQDEIKLTKEGEKLLESYSDLLQRNKDIIVYIDKVIEKYHRYTTQELKNLVYDMEFPMPNGKIKIKDIQHYTDMLFILPETEVKKEFKLTEEDIETLDILSDTELFNSLKESIKEARKKPSSIFLPS